MAEVNGTVDGRNPQTHEMNWVVELCHKIKMPLCSPALFSSVLQNSKHLFAKKKKGDTIFFRKRKYKSAVFTAKMETKDDSSVMV